jgi:hypothetical protein
MNRYNITLNFYSERNEFINNTGLSKLNALVELIPPFWRDRVNTTELFFVSICCFQSSALGFIPLINPFVCLPEEYVLILILTLLQGS